MCDKCGNSECCRVVITKQGERGLQGPTGPPGATGPTGPSVTAENVGTGLGWFKQKTGLVLEFFKALGSSSIEVTQVTDDIQFSIVETEIIDHTIADVDITSSVFTINSVSAKTYSYKELHNKMIYYTGTLAFNGTFTGVDGTFSLNTTLANLPKDIAVSDLDVVYLQLTGATQELLNVRAQISGTQINFSRSDYAFTNGAIYDVFISYSGTKPIN